MMAAASHEVGTKHASALVLDLPTSRAMRNRCLPFKPPSIWCFVTAAWANSDVSGERRPDKS